MATLTPELIYLLKVNAGIALFYAFYKLFCCRDTFFQWRRTALLSFLALSFIYPLMDIQAWVKEQPAMKELADYYAALLITDTATATNTALDTTANTLPVPSLASLLAVIYLGGVILLTLRFIVQLLSIFRLVVTNRSIRIDGVKVKSLSDPANPFSFGPWIFLYLPGLKEEDRQEILTHELTHVRQGHSADIILSELANIVCWMNPFSWLLKTEIRLNLEYLADHQVAETVTDTRRYQYHLLGLASPNRQTGLYNNFNLSHLKNRIMMMNKKRTRTTGRIKYALFAPLAAALLLVSNIESVARTAERLVKDALEVVEAPATAPQQDTQKVTTFTVTVVDKDGKKLDGVQLQTKLNDKLLTFQTGADGRAEVKLELGGLNHAFMHASARDGRECYFTLTQGTHETTVNIDKDGPNFTNSPDENGVYSVVEEMPEFPGGMMACVKFLANNIKYPAAAIEAKEQGKVIVQFIVEKDGSVSNIRVVRSISPLLDQEAVRVTGR